MEHLLSKQFKKVSHLLRSNGSLVPRFSTSHSNVVHSIAALFPGLLRKEVVLLPKNQLFGEGDFSGINFPLSVRYIPNGIRPREQDIPIT